MSASLKTRVRKGSFTPIRTEAPAGGSTAYNCPSRLDGRRRLLSGRSNLNGGGL